MALINLQSNFNTNVMTLTFDVATELENENLENFKLQNAASSPTFEVSLYGSTITSGISPTTVYQVTLSDAAIAKIKSQTTALTSNSNTFMSTVYPSTATVQSTAYTADTLALSLVNFAILNRNILRLGFNKPIISVTDLTNITIQNNISISNPGAQYRTLTGGTVVINPLVVYIELNAADLSAINNLNLTTANAYISMEADVFDDWRTNGSIEILDTNAQKADYVGPTPTYKLPSTVEISSTIYGIAMPTATGLGTITTPSIVTVSEGNVAASLPNITRITGNLVVVGNSQLGNVGNVQITGGSGGQYLQTDGAGNLSWQSVTSLGTVDEPNIVVVSETGGGGGGGGGFESSTTVSPFMFNAIGAGDEIYVGISNSGTCAVSDDSGFTWTTGTCPAATYTSQIVYGNGLFLATTQLSNLYITSVDGLTWTSRTLPSSGTWYVAFTGSTFVAVKTASSEAATSTDGINWTSVTIDAGNPLSSNWYRVVYGNGTLVAPGGSNVSAISTDEGATWTRVNLPISGFWLGPGFNGSVFALIDRTTRNVYTSPDGVTWTLRDTLPAVSNPSAGAWGAVSVIGTTFVVVSNRLDATTSTDGITWTPQTVDYFPPLGLWVGTAVSEDILLAFNSYNTEILQIRVLGDSPSSTVNGTLIVTNQSRLGDVANVNITGGNSGQYLQTDGTGNLTWANIDVGEINSISNGNTDVTIAAANGNITGNIDGVKGLSITTGANGIVTLGYQAGNSGANAGIISIGSQAHEANAGNNAIAIGSQAGKTAAASNSIAIGQSAGSGNTTANSIYIGAAAGIDGGSLANVIILNSSGSNLNPTVGNAFYVSSVRSNVTTSNVLYYNNTTKEISFGPPTGGGGGGNSISNGNTDVSIGTANGNITGNIAGSKGLLISTGINSIVSLGYQAGLNASNARVISIGSQAHEANPRTDAIAIGQQAGRINAAANTIAIGQSAGSANTGANSIYIGLNAGSNGGNFNNVIVLNSGGSALNPSANNSFYVSSIRNDTSNITNALYWNTTTRELTYGPAGSGGIGNTIRNGNTEITIATANGNITGNLAGARILNITTDQIIAIGNNAGGGNSSPGTVSIGNSAGIAAQDSAVAIGNRAAQSSQQSQAIAIGFRAGGTSQNVGAVAIGGAAGLSNQAWGAVAVGYQSGYTSQRANSVAVGSNAGYNILANYAVAVGYFSGYTNSGANSIYIGANAGSNAGGFANVIVLNATGANFNPTAANATFITPLRGNVSAGNVVYYNNSTGELTYAPPTGGSGGNSISNGNTDITIAAANGNITGNIAGFKGLLISTGINGIVSLGYQAGLNSPNARVISIGSQAHEASPRTDAIALGQQAGRINAAADTIAIGRNAGYANTTANSIYIGLNAGNNGGSFANVIVLNSSGSNLNPTVGNAFYVSSVRNDTGNTTNAVYWNSTTKELTYGPAGGGGGNSISNGTSNVTIPAANGNVNISVGGQANRLVVSSTGANITGTANITGNLTAANAALGNLVTANFITISNVANVVALNANGNVNFTGANVSLGTVANIRINGGANGQFLQTNGSGILSWSALSVDRISNANTSVVTNASNVITTVNGNLSGAIDANRVVLGYQANSSGNSGVISIGLGAGALGTHGQFAITIGAYAGNTGTPGQFSTAVGTAVGPLASSATAIGYQAAAANSSANSLYLGARAGNNGGSFANVIVLNSTGAAFNPTAANAFYVSSVRQAYTANLISNVANVGIMTYDTTTGEIRQGAPIFTYALENFTAAGAATGTINLDFISNSIVYYSTNATGNITLNIRGNATTTANSVLAVGQAITCTFIINTGTTGYTVTALQVDGTTRTVRYAGGSTPTANANSTVSFTYTIMKTAATPTYTVLGTQTVYG